ncbi:MAG: anti-sigma factor [Gemmatimonadales bacterium]
MSEETRDTLTDLAPAYVLGALSPEETRAFERALAKSPDLQREVAEYRELSALLGTAEPMAPPPALKQQLLERVQQTKTVDFTERAAPPAPQKQGGRVMQWILAAGLVAAGLVVVLLWRDGQRLARELAQRDTLLAERTTKLVQREAELNAILEPSVQLITMTATGDTPPVVQVFWNRARNSMLLHAFRLRPAPSGRAYQLWFIPRRGAPIASSVFNTEPDGHGLVPNIQVPGEPAILGFALTEEPAGGSLLPTTTPILSGRTAPIQ